jgi:hypothetical protein
VTGEKEEMKIVEEPNDKLMGKSSSNNRPSPVSFIVKPSPSRTLNDLEEAGRVRVLVHFEHLHDNAEMSVKYVTAKIANNTKTRPIISVTSTLTEVNLNSGSNFEENVNTYSSAQLSQRGRDTWYGEIVIPCNWLEGGSKSFERTGSFSPYYNDNLFTMTITCKLFNDQMYERNESIVELHSTDAFHWKQE